MRWFFPQYCGDFRLIEVDDSSYRQKAQASKDTCVLEVVDPTAHEVTLLEAFLADAVKEKWTSFGKIDVVEVDGKRRQEIHLATPIAKAGTVLYKHLRPGNRTITGVRSEGGVVQVYEANDLAKVEEVLKPDAVVPAAAKPKDVVSASRPTPSCPQCVPGSVSRASEVLQAFLSPDEHESWSRERYVIVEGGLSGHRYMLAHRHSSHAIKVGRICYDLDDDLVVHFHDNSVPPEEEILAAKLILQHREDWLRNEATLFHAFGSTEIYKNPFGNSGDGVEEAVQTQNIGAALQVLLGLGR